MAVVRACKRYFQRNYAKLFTFTLIAFFSQLFALFTPYLVGNFIDGLNESQTLAFILKYCTAFLLLSLFNLLLNYVSNLLYINIQMTASYRFNTDLVFHVQQASISYSENIDLAHLNQQINTDVNVLTMFTLGFCQHFIVNLFMLPFVVAICVILNPPVASVLLAFSLLYVLLFLATKKLLFRYDYACKEAQSHFFGRMYEQLANIRFLKENSAESFFRARLDEPYNTLYKTTIKNQKFSMMFGNLDSLIGYCLQIALYLFGGYGIITKQFSIGLFVMFSSYFSLVMSCLRYFLNFGKEYERAQVSLHRLLEIQRVSEEITGTIQVDNCQTIRVQALTFQYKNNKEVVLRNFSCIFSKGTTTCLVGHNGAGKSTLIGVLLGLYNDRLPKGCIQYDNQDIQDLNSSYLRRHLVSVVAQTPYVFTGSLWENLLLENPTESQRQRVESLASILGLPQNITKSNDPLQGLSNGEKQKIAIIRAFIRDTHVLILDEPTSALDFQSSKALMQLIEQSKSEKIIIIVSHDMSIAKQCDTIVHFS